MTHYSSVNVKLCDSQLNNLKSATKDVNETTTKLLSNMIGDSNDETNFTHKALLTLVSPCKAFANDLLTNIKLSKTQISKIMQLVWNS